MFLRLLAHSLTRRKSRKLLAIATVWIGISLIVALLALNMDVGDKVNLELQSFGSNIRVEPVLTSVPVRVGGYEISAGSPAAYLNESDLARLKAIFWRNNILAISPRLWGQAQIQGTEIPIVGMWFDHSIPVTDGEAFVTGGRQAYPQWQVEGSWPSSDTAFQSLVGVELARRWNFSVGDSIQVETDRETMRLNIVGVVTSGVREDEALIVPLRSAQRVFGLPGKVSEIDVNALTTPENELAEKYHRAPKALSPEEYERWVCTP